MNATEPRWLDRLARRAAGRDRGTPPVRVVERGLSRRTALRVAGATVVLAGSLRTLAAPPAARADALSDCLKDNSQRDHAVYESCIDHPSKAYTHFQSALRHAQNALRTAKTKAQKAKLQQIIKQASEGMEQSIQQLQDCNAQYLHNRAVSEDECRTKNPPPPSGGAGGGGGGGAGGGSSGCPEGTTLCSQSGPITTCCYGTDTCCSCEGGITCCIYNDCRCCS